MLKANEHTLPAVFAQKTDIDFDSAIYETELRNRTERFLRDMTHTLINEGCELIGHIKGLFAAGTAGYLMFSLTSHDKPVSFKGELKTGIRRTELTVNIIVYGVGSETVKTAFEKAFKEFCVTEY
jgi:hypothetical protein